MGHPHFLAEYMPAVPIAKAPPAIDRRTLVQHRLRALATAATRAIDAVDAAGHVFETHAGLALVVTASEAFDGIEQLDEWAAELAFYRGLSMAEARRLSVRGVLL